MLSEKLEFSLANNSSIAELEFTFSFNLLYNTLNHKNRRTFMLTPVLETNRLILRPFCFN